MSEIASFEDLTGGGEVDVEDVELSTGKIVRVRGLSRYEYMLAGKEAGQGDGELDANVFEALVVQYGTVEPNLSAGQVKAWQRTPGRAADFAKVDAKIMEMSKLGEGADKSDLRDVRDEP